MEWEPMIRCLLRLLGHTNEAYFNSQMSLLGRPDISTLRLMWYEIYKESIREKVFNRIEDLEGQDKRELWQSANEIGPTLSRDEKIKLSKCLYAINHYTKPEVCSTFLQKT